jgi:hypothetical protein
MEMLTFIFPNYRKNSQKPDEELYSNFKQTFTEVCAPTPAAKIQRGASLGDALMGQSLPPRLVYSLAQSAIYTYIPRRTDVPFSGPTGLTSLTLRLQAIYGNRRYKKPRTDTKVAT